MYWVLLLFSLIFVENMVSRTQLKKEQFKSHNIIILTLKLETNKNLNKHKLAKLEIYWGAFANI